jgi:hypothetical protein
MGAGNPSMIAAVMGPPVVLHIRIHGAAPAAEVFQILLRIPVVVYVYGPLCHVNFSFRLKIIKNIKMSFKGI